MSEATAKERIAPQDRQICVVEFEDGTRQYAIWSTEYSIYGSGGHFQLGNGGMVGIPIDIAQWWGTHWLTQETPDIAVTGKQDLRHDCARTTTLRDTSDG